MFNSLASHQLFEIRLMPKTLNEGQKSKSGGTTSKQRKIGRGEERMRRREEEGERGRGGERERGREMEGLAEQRNQEREEGRRCFMMS